VVVRVMVSRDRGNNVDLDRGTARARLFAMIEAGVP
jgi:hypothetical protein